MAPFQIDETRIQEFDSAPRFHDWLARHHATEPEIWIKLHKKASGLTSITAQEAIDICLCWGWIDAIRKSLDDRSYLQRYVPRGTKSVWSEINVANVARLTEEGRMTEHGLRHVEAAKADGRWANAYRVKGAAVPQDLSAAIAAEPEAQAMFERLSAQNRFALIFRLSSLKTDAGRRKRIAALVDMLKRGETLHPQKR